MIRFSCIYDREWVFCPQKPNLRYMTWFFRIFFIRELRFSCRLQEYNGVSSGVRNLVFPLHFCRTQFLALFHDNKNYRRQIISLSLSLFIYFTKDISLPQMNLKMKINLTYFVIICYNYNV